MQDEIFENLIKNSLKEIGFKLCAVIYEKKYIVATKDNTTKIITYSDKKSAIRSLRSLVFETNVRNKE